MEIILKLTDGVLIYSNSGWDREKQTKLKNTWPAEITRLGVEFILKSMSHSFMQLKITKHLLFRSWF